MLYSNLGGSGPDDWAPTGIRYVNVGSAATSSAGAFRFDLVVTNRTYYRAADPRLNGVSGQFARINFQTNALEPTNNNVTLRVTVHFSCCSAASCALCDDPSLSATDKEACYSAGCCCFGATCTTEDCCTGDAKEEKRRAYDCEKSDSPVVVRRRRARTNSTATHARAAPALTHTQRPLSPDLVLNS